MKCIKIQNFSITFHNKICESRRKKSKNGTTGFIEQKGWKQGI